MEIVPYQNPRKLRRKEVKVNKDHMYVQLLHDTYKGEEKIIIKLWYTQLNGVYSKLCY